MDRGLLQWGGVGQVAPRPADGPVDERLFPPAVQSPGRLGKHAHLAGVFWHLLDHLAHHSHRSRHERTGQCH